MIIVSGPTEVQPGSIATFVVDVGSFGGPARTVVLAADVPEGWTLVDSLYEGTIQGRPVSGQGHVVLTPGACSTALIRPGFQRIFLDGGTLPEAIESDTGTITLRFLVESQPDGEYQVGFRFGGWYGSSGSCSSFAVRTLNRERGPLGFLQALFDETYGVEGLFGVSGIDVSPQGDLVLAAGTHDRVLSVFSRAGDGTLTFLETVPELPADPVKGLVSIMDDVLFGPTGTSAYWVRRQSDEIAVYSRQGHQLELVQTITSNELPNLDSLVDFTVYGDKAYALANGKDLVGFDGKRIVVFRRDIQTGELTFLSTVPATEFQWNYADAKDLAVSADGSQIYASFVDPTFGFLSVLARDQTTGIPSHQQTVQFGAGGPASSLEIRNIVSSSDGSLVFTTSTWVLSTYRRDFDGNLTWLQDYPLAQLGFGQLGSSQLASGPGNLLWVSGRGWIGLFRYDSAGNLSLLDMEFDRDPPNQGIDATIDITLSPDGRQLYIADLASSAVATFDSGIEVFADGFESGDTASWSAVVD